MRDITLFIHSILHLPDTFYASGNISVINLLNSMSFNKYINDITAIMLYEELLKYPLTAVNWLEWSSNKRTNEGWYFMKVDNNKFVVGEYSNELNNNQFVFDDLYEACSFYIFNELKYIHLRNKDDLTLCR